MIIDNLIINCAPNIDLKLMKSIITVESGGNEYAINVNGYIHLLRQPSNYYEAVGWINYLEKNNYNFDIGIAQINIKNIHKFRLKAIDALNPCVNLRLANIILVKEYIKVTKLFKYNRVFNTLSAYNSGNYTTGYNNNYIKKIILHLH